MVEMDDLELEISLLLPRITDANKLEEIAFVLELDIPEDLRGEARRLNRHILWYLNSNDFDAVPTRGTLLAKVVRMAQTHLGVDGSVREQDVLNRGNGGLNQGGARLRTQGGDGGGGGATGNAGLLIQVDGGNGNGAVPLNNSPPFRMQPPSLYRYSQPNFGFNAPTSYATSRMQVPRAQMSAQPPSPPLRQNNVVQMQNRPISSVGGSSNLQVPRPRGCNQTFPRNNAGGPNVQQFNPFQNHGAFRASTPNVLNANNPFSPNNLAVPAPQNLGQPLIPNLHAGSPNVPQPSPPNCNDMGYYPGGGPRPFGRMRELKLSGQIGNPGEAGKLSYSSLSFQIANARARHFDDAEICAAVIRAITPNLPLRNYLERQRHLSLDMLISRLRTHFLLKGATAR